MRFRKASIAFAHRHAIVIFGIQSKPIQAVHIFCKTLLLVFFFRFSRFTFLCISYCFMEHNVKVIAYKSGLRFILFV